MSSRLLAISIAVALLFSGWWLFAARNDRRTVYLEVPAGESGHWAGLSLTAAGLTQQPRITDRYGNERVAVEGATFVVARIDYDVEGVDPEVEVICSATLQGEGQVSWISLIHTPADDQVSATCDRNGTGTMEALFEVPVRLLPTVAGVGLSVTAVGSEESQDILLETEIS